MDLEDLKDQRDLPGPQVSLAALDHPDHQLDLECLVDLASQAREDHLAHEESLPKLEALVRLVSLDQLETQDDLVNLVLMDHVDLQETLESLESLDPPEALEFPVTLDHEDHKGRADLPVTLVLLVLLEPI